MTTCGHHWDIAPANGPTSTGVCRNCGALQGVCQHCGFRQKVGYPVPPGQPGQHRDGGRYASSAGPDTGPYEDEVTMNMRQVPVSERTQS